MSNIGRWTKKVNRRIVRKRSFILGIAGGTGSGKSWLMQRLADEFGRRVSVIQSDCYYRGRSRVKGEARLRLNFDHPRAIEVPLIVSHLLALKGGDAVEAPQYDYATHRRLKRTIRIEPRPILIVEGLFVLREVSIRRLIDHGIFIDVPADQRLILRLKRDSVSRRLDVFETLRLYESFARPMHEKFVEPSRNRASEVWKGLPTEARIRKLVRRLESLIK